MNTKNEKEQTYPETYLHIEEGASGETWIVPIRGDTKLDLTKLVKKWIAEHFHGAGELTGPIMPRLEGHFYARIMTDGRPPSSGVCWTSGGFFVDIFGG